MPQLYFDLPYLKTMAGATVATILITEFLKEFPLLKKLRTKILTFFIAFLIVLTSQVATGDFVLANFFLYVLDALLIAFSAIGGWETLNGGKK